MKLPTGIFVHVVTASNLPLNFALKCQQRLCDVCFNKHRFSGCGKSSQISSLEQKKVLDGHVDYSVSHYCNNHRERKSEIYCNECWIVDCTVGSLDEHKQHEAFDVTEFYKRQNKK